jgi:hypothetical protein
MVKQTQKLAQGMMHVENMSDQQIHRQTYLLNYDVTAPDMSEPWSDRAKERYDGEHCNHGDGSLQSLGRPGHVHICCACHTND